MVLDFIDYVTAKYKGKKKSHFYYILKYCDEQQGNVQALSGIPWFYDNYICELK